MTSQPAPRPLVQAISGVTCAYSEARKTELDLTADNGSELRILPLDFGSGMAESNGMVRDRRRHDWADGFSFSLETRTTIPFGVEPEIRRTVEFAGNHAAVTVDLQLKAGLPIKSLSLDPVVITGPFTRIGVVGYPGDEGRIGKIKWKSPTEEREEVLYRSPRPFLCCVAETEAGQRWEVGTGDDLWRWQCAGRYRAEAEFRVIRKGNELRIEREVYRRKDENTTMPERNLRFQWYVAWDGGRTPPPRKSGALPMTTVPMGEFPSASSGLKHVQFAWTGSFWPENACFMPQPGSVGDAPCAVAHPVVKRYKNWIRTATRQYSGQTLKLDGVSAPYCCAAGHLERNQRPELAHGSMMALFDLWNWGNRQLVKNGNAVVFLAADETAFRTLPSLNGLMRPPLPLE